MRCIVHRLMTLRRRLQSPRQPVHTASPDSAGMCNLEPSTLFTYSSYGAMGAAGALRLLLARDDDADEDG